MKTNKELVRSFIEEVWNSNSPEKANYYIDPNFTIHLLGGKKDSSGIEFVINNVKTAHEKYRNLHIKIEDIIEEGDKTVCRLLLTAIIERKLVSSREFILHKISNGKFIEAWSLGSIWD